MISNEPGRERFINIPQTCERPYRSCIIQMANQNVPFCAEWADKEVTPTRLQGFCSVGLVDVVSSPESPRGVRGIRVHTFPSTHVPVGPMQRVAFSIFSHSWQTASLLTFRSWFMFSSRCVGSARLHGGWVGVCSVPTKVYQLLAW